MTAGYQVVPNVLIQAHHELGLAPLDVLILLNINMHWWKASVLPYPKPSLIAERIGVSRRTVERRLRAMEKAGLIERLSSEQVRGTSIRRIRLDGLVKRLAKIAETSLSRRNRNPADSGLDEAEDADEKLKVSGGQ